ncbi:carbonic anhydrase [Marichromatium sp. AB32]|uniref:carbonic anhydrase n=1 Tax=Marichromatium sp. AB32 TaxID=2483363 RepID=UPI000F412B22|nr:carbonic anhydrase family protein [Marichromatium sp. AB32]RNE92826.1 carbonic anhydrase family protein [Marichromatium sp. AB32]
MRSQYRCAVGLAVLAALWGGGAVGDDGLSFPVDPPWDYVGDAGPEHWGELDPSFATCAEGRSQSPIDIRGARRIVYTPLLFRYRSHLLELVNTGRGIRLLTPPGSALVIRGSAYDLSYVDFHVPGEHRIEGERYDAELQLVHHDRQGGHAVVAVGLRAAERDNRIFERILDHLPARPGERTRHRQIGVNPLFLLPLDRGYFRYHGSLTQPPCRESALWLVFGEPLEVGVRQLQRLRAVIGENARPVQPRNGREVLALPRY